MIMSVDTQLESTGQSYFHFGSKPSLNPEYTNLCRLNCNHEKTFGFGLIDGDGVIDIIHIAWSESSLGSRGRVNTLQSGLQSVS